MFLVGRHKPGISAVQLMNDLALGCYRTAWMLLHKLRATMAEGTDWPLKGEVEVDETLIGAKGKGDPSGKDPGHKSIVAGAVALGDVTRRLTGRRRGKRIWAGVRLRMVPDYTEPTLGGFVQDTIAQGSLLLTDGWKSYPPLREKGYEVRSEASSQYTRAGIRRADPLPHVHLLFSNLKVWLAGTFHGVSRKYLPRYLNEFVYRVNRRRDATAKLFDWVARRATRSGPRPLKILRLAESCT